MGEGEGGRRIAVLEKAGYADIVRRKDYGGRERVIRARWR
jgi:hypothetical protein